MYFFQLPRIPEWLLMRRNGAMVSELLRRSGQTPAAADRDAQAMSEPGALTPAINRYRAIPLSNPRARVASTKVVYESGRELRAGVS
jgi:hypothetical protein